MKDAAMPVAVPGSRRIRRYVWITAIFVTAVAVVVAGLILLQRDDNRDILSIAFTYPNGGGYCSLQDTGVSEPVVHKGIVILKASRGGSYCCGFTFLVAFKAAAQRGLLDNKEAYEIKRCQREWYGSTRATAEKECVDALVHLGIGHEVDPQAAISGDFVTFQRKSAPAHSVIFLDWIYDNGIVVGLRYRSSQGATGGIGDFTEYFTSSRYEGALINPHRFYVVRLNRR